MPPTFGIRRDGNLHGMSFIPFTMALVAAFVALVPLGMVAVILSGAAVAPAPVRRK